MWGWASLCRILKTFAAVSCFVACLVFAIKLSSHSNFKLDKVKIVVEMGKSTWGDKHVLSCCDFRWTASKSKGWQAYPLAFPPSFTHSAFSSTVGVMLSYIELDLAHTKSYTQAESCWNRLTHHKTHWCFLFGVCQVRRNCLLSRAHPLAGSPGWQSDGEEGKEGEGRDGGWEAECPQRRLASPGQGSEEGTVKPDVATAGTTLKLWKS